MPIELPMFEEGQCGLTLCVCGEIKSSDPMPDQQKAQIAKYNALGGEVFIRASISGKKTRTLYVDCAKAVAFSPDHLPTPTTEKIEGVFRVIESVYNLSLQATVCASFRVPLVDLPESGLIRSLLFEGKSADASIKMTGATFVLSRAPIIGLKWRLASAKTKPDAVYIDLKANREFRVSDTYLSDVWRWIYEQFSLFVLGQRKADPASPTGSGLVGK